MGKSKTVCLTSEAHALLAGMAHDCDSSMKNVVSEAITRMANRTRDEKRYAFGTFALGAITGGVLMFFVGMAI